MALIDRIALLLAIVGGVNWGLVGIFRFDLVAWFCGGQTAAIARIIYTLVGQHTGISTEKFQPWASAQGWNSVRSGQ